jgi:ABC-2 type transport system ATP-binding protein
MKPVIELDKVTKLYGPVVGAESVTLQVETGSIFGFLGPNGAGKTTTISMMVNLIKPTSGQIKIFGLDNQSEGRAIRARIGYLAGDMAMDRSLTGMQQLEYLGSLRGGFDKSYAVELAKRLNCDLKRKFKTLSRGNKQKVGLIAALMHKPELLILDEPTSGLDPLVQAEFNKIILDHKANGGTTFISSHVLSEVQELCDQVAFIREGKLIANKPLSEITSAAPKEVRVLVSNGDPKDCVKGLKGVSNSRVQDKMISFSYQGNQLVLTTHLAKCPIKDLTIRDAELDEIFMKFYEKQHV